MRKATTSRRDALAWSMAITHVAMTMISESRATQKALATAIGMHESSLSYARSGRYVLRLESILALCSVLNVKPVQMFKAASKLVPGMFEKLEAEGQ